MSEVTEVQIHEANSLFECILIRDGQATLPCWFPMSDVQTIVKYICTMWGFFVLYVFIVYLGMIYVINK